MGAKISKNATPPTNSSRMFFKFILNFLPNGPHKMM